MLLLWSNQLYFVFKGTYGYRWWSRYQRTSGMYSFQNIIYYFSNIFTIHDYGYTEVTWLTLRRVILVHKVQVAILDPLAHQDLREAPVSLVSKDNWYTGSSFSMYKQFLLVIVFLMCRRLICVACLYYRETLVYQDLKERLDPKEKL